MRDDQQCRLSARHARHLSVTPRTASAARWPLRPPLRSCPAGRCRSSRRRGRSRGSASTVGGRGGPPGASENVARCSRTTTDRVTRRVAAAGSARVELAPRLRRQSRRCPARPDRRRRWRRATGAPAPSPKIAHLSKTQCIGPPTSPTNWSDVIGPSNQRLTVTIGELPVARARLAAIAASGAGTSPVPESREARATARVLTTARGRDRRRRRRGRRRRRRDRRGRRAPGSASTHAPAALLDEPLAPARRRARRAAPRAARSPSPRRAGRTARRARARTAPRRPRPGIDSAPRSRADARASRRAAASGRARASQSATVCRGGHARRPPPRRRARRTSSRTGRAAAALNRSRSGKRPPAQHAGDQMPGRPADGGQSSVERPAVAAGHRQAKPRLQRRQHRPCRCRRRNA